MSSIFDETVIRLNQVPPLVPLRPAIATVYRWAAKGVDGVRLETAKAGGRVVTSTEAVDRFLAATDEKGRPAEPARPTPARERRLRERDHAMTEARLMQSLGVTPGQPGSPGERRRPTKPAASNAGSDLPDLSVSEAMTHTRNNPTEATTKGDSNV